MKIKRIILKLFLFTLIFFNAVSDEINFEAKNIELKQNGKILLAYESNLQLPSKNISIDSTKLLMVTSCKYPNLKTSNPRRSGVLTDSTNSILLSGVKRAQIIRIALEPISIAPIIFIDKK